MKKFAEIESTFKLVYEPLSKAIANCLLDISNSDNRLVDATSVICAIMSVAVDISRSANKISKEKNKPELLINADNLARFVALMISTSLPVSDDVKKALDNLACAGLDKHNVDVKTLN